MLKGGRRLRDQARQVSGSGLTPLQRFAKYLKRYVRGTFASARFPRHTSLLQREKTHPADQTHGLWLPGLGVLLPENHGHRTRESTANLRAGRFPARSYQSNATIDF